MKKHLILFYLLFWASNLGALSFWNNYQAYKHYQKHDYENAAKNCEQLLAADPENMQNLINMGCILYQQGKYPEATNYFEQALRQDSSLKVKMDVLQKIELLFNLGSAYAQQENWQAALDHYTELIKLDPKHARALKNIEIIKKLLEKQKEQANQQNQENHNQEQSQDEQSKPNQDQNKQDQNKQEEDKQEQDKQSKDDQTGKQPENQSGHQDGESEKQKTNQPKTSQENANQEKNKHDNSSQVNQTNAQQQANQENLAKLSGQEKEYLEAIEQNDQRASRYLMKMQMQGTQGQKNEEGNNW